MELTPNLSAIRALRPAWNKGRVRPFADIQRLAAMLRSQPALLPFWFDAVSRSQIVRRWISEVPLDIHALMKDPHDDKIGLGPAKEDDMAPG